VSWAPTEAAGHGHSATETKALPPLTLVASLMHWPQNTAAVALSSLAVLTGATEPNAMWPSMGSHVHRTSGDYCGHATKTYHVDCPMPFPMAKCSVEVLRTLATQCPLANAQAQACKTKHRVKHIGVKAQPANANGQCPTRKARRNKFFSLFSPDNVCNKNPPLACSPMASSHGELHAHAQPQNQGTPLNTSMPL
jgi:hypothetical protein